MNFWNYLSFKSKLAFFDRWLSYLSLIWIYYYFEERDWYVLTPIISSVLLSNGINYYYINKLEKQAGLYQCLGDDENEEYEPLAGIKLTKNSFSQY